MEEIMKQIALYHRLSVLCIVGMLICVGISAFIYKKLNIRAVLSYFKRNRKKSYFLLMLMIWGVLGYGLSMPVLAVQIEEELPGELPEEPADMSPVLEEFSVYSQDEEREFTAEGVQIKISIRDEQDTFDETKVVLEYRIAGQELWEQLPGEEQLWNNPEEDVFTADCLFEGDGTFQDLYEFRVSYTDSAGNEMVPDENISAEPKRIVIDQVAPVYVAVYTDEKGETLIFEENSNAVSPYYNAAKEVVLDFQVTESYLDEEKTTVKIISSDRKGNILKEDSLKIVEGKFQTVIKTDGHYKVEVHLFDKAGNETIHEKTFALDHESPKQPVITYTTKNDGLLERMVNQLTFGYFAKEKVTAHVQAEDVISGVKQITYSYEDVDTKKTITETLEAVEESVEIDLPFSFKGNLTVYSEDFVGNKSEEFTDTGVIAESEDAHLAAAYGNAKVLTKYSKTPDYYAGNVRLRFAAKDTYSGIRSICYLAGQDDQETAVFGDKEEIVTNDIVREVEISAAAYEGNHVMVGMSFKDNAGHETVLSEEELPVIHIDTTAPKVRVVYDNYDAENEKYYRESRTATVYVEERNFDPEDVDFEIVGPDVRISSWSHHGGEGCQGSADPYHTGHGDGCVWKCQVNFTEDGDYRFGFSCTDLAGNKGSCGKTDEFVIDRTKPEIRVTYDHNDVKNEIYYRKSRIATIAVTEKNFQPEDVEIRMTAEREGQNTAVPHVSGWRSHGDIHEAMITYDYDAFFSFDIDYIDLAGNVVEDYPGDYFCVDLTKPEIIISEVADRSANNGIVSPLITITDENYGAGSAWFEVTGWQNGIVDTAKAAAAISNGEMIRIQDFAHVQTADDLYRLEVGAEDLAGNVSEVSIRFSVNRFGSVYTLDGVTERLAGKGGTYYTDVEKQLVITETNVDTLEFQEIVCSLNGKLRTLREGVDYTVQENGDETSWKQYRYEIKENNFAQEGHYTLTIYSEDRANNLSDNQSKGKSISFAVDKSVPSIVISGVENEERYREEGRHITVDVQDNLALAKVTVIYDGNTKVYDQQELQLLDGKLTFDAESKNDWQRLQIFAEDCAGNEISSEEIVFLVTPDVLVQFYNNKPLFYGGLAVVLVSGGCMSLYVFRKCRKK